MLTKEQCEVILSRCMQSEADFAELFEEDTTSEGISMLNGDVEEMNRVVRAGIGIRLYKGVQSVYGYTNELDQNTVFALVDDLKSALGTSNQEVTIRLTESVIENHHPIVKDPIEASLEEKVALLKRAYKAAKEADDRIVKVTGSLSSVCQKVQISTSEGKFVKDTRTRVRMPITAFAQDASSMQSGSDSPGASQGLEFFDQTAPESIGKEAARTALVLLEAKDCPSGKMPVVIDNGFGGVIFHEACGHSLEATSVAKNPECLYRKVE